MAAALGTLRVSEAGGRLRAVSFYLSDAANVLAKFDEAKVAIATSNDHFQANAPCNVVDVCLTSDTATPTHLQVLVNGKPTGDLLDCTAMQISVVNRPNMLIGLRAGDKFQLMQL